MANFFYLDASALAKRFIQETGTPEVNEVLDTVPGDRLRVLNIGMGQIVSVMVRKRNAGTISSAYFDQALLDFKAEVVRASHLK